MSDTEDTVTPRVRAALVRMDEGLRVHGSPVAYARALGLDGDLASINRLAEHGDGVDATVAFIAGFVAGALEDAS